MRRSSEKTGKNSLCNLNFWIFMNSFMSFSSIGVEYRFIYFILFSFSHQNVDFIPSVAWMITSSRNQQQTGNKCKRKKATMLKK